MVRVEQNHEAVFSQLLNDPARNWSEEDIRLLQSAYTLACAAHDGQMRASGQPYIIHPVSVSVTVSNLGMDCDSVAAALLHDTVEDTPLTVADIAAATNADVATIVDGVTKLDAAEAVARADQLGSSPSGKAAGSLQKLLVAATGDVRVLVVKLADRLHNVSTLAWLAPEKQARVAEETLSVYAPLAHRLGMDVVRAELEDKAFAALYPDLYTEISTRVRLANPPLQVMVDHVASQLSDALAAGRIPAEVFGRNKSVYSVYRKMVARKIALEDVHDLVGVRVLVGNVDDAYRALGVTQNLLTPVPGRLRDYVASPKFNGYQSLHTTTVVDGVAVEVQIRTWDMHAAAEFGVAAHWKYRYDQSGPVRPEHIALSEHLPWLGHLAGLMVATDDPDDYLKALRADLSAGQIAVFVPGGHMVNVAEGSTCVAAAEAAGLSSVLGVHVNGELVSDEYVLRPGDRLTWLPDPSAPQHPPLHPSTELANLLGVQASILAPDWVEKIDMEQLASVLGTTAMSLPTQIRSGAINEALVALAVARLVDADSTPVLVDKLGSLPLVSAPCCNPKSGDPVVAILAHQVAVAHKVGCEKVPPGPLVEVDWPAPVPVSAKITVVGVDRHGFLSDVARVVSDAGLNVVGHGGCTGADRVAHLDLWLSLSSRTQLAHVCSALLGVPGVFSVDSVDKPTDIP